MRLPYPRTLPEFARQFGTEAACTDYLARSRWPDGFRCPRDGLPAATYVKTRGLWTCSRGHQTSATARETIFHRTKQRLCDWFWAAYAMATYTPGVSAWQMAKHLGLRYETAFQMLHKLRAGMVAPERTPISGIIEMDGTYIGGRRKGRPGRAKARGKYLILVAVEIRGEAAGRVRIRRVGAESWAAVNKFMEKNVATGSTVRTDGLRSYDKLRGAGYGHIVVTGADSVEVARKMKHVHRVISNLKTWLLGTHHGVSGKHLQAYLNEFTFRFNRRGNPMAAFQTLLGIGSQVSGPTYRGLYAAGRKTGWAHPNPRRSSATA